MFSNKLFRHVIFLAIITFCFLSGKFNHSPLQAADNEKKQEAKTPEKTDKPFGLNKRTPWTTSRVEGFPEPLPPYKLEIAFPNLKFKQPIAMFPEPGTNQLFILELDGKLLALEENHQAKQTDLIEIGVFKPDPLPDPVIDKKTKKKTEYKPGKRQTQCFTFHPNYKSNGFIFVVSDMYNPQFGDIKPRRFMRVTRYKLIGKNSKKVDMKSEKIIIEWDSDGHTGGDLDFGPDGYLYISCGDGSSDSDNDDTGQDISDLTGSIIRIDVDNPDKNKAYRIPADNPFAKMIGARPEIWSFGHRAPWRMSFDEKTGDLWLGDVGQDLWEMIHLVKRGANYGWSVREGNHPFRPERKQGPVPISPPIVEHHHSESRSITGGLVYYGSRLKELYGYYIYCDYATGTVWGFQYKNNQVENHQILARTNWQVPSFGYDHKGEIYSVALTGEILHLVPQKQKTSDKEFPKKLSETGLFTSVSKQKSSPGVIPYSVNASTWNDSCSIERYLAIPDEGKITWKENRGWDFSDRTVAVQTISMQLDNTDPESKKHIETRILTKQSGEWYGYSYRWNSEQTDAFLVPGQGESFKLALMDNGLKKTHTWNIPGRSECMVCHSRAANFVLGLTTLQLNKNHDYSGIVDNQIRTFEHIGLFDKPLKKTPKKFKQLVPPHDLSKNINDRARSYLHANCAHCHISAGGGNARIELEFVTEKSKTNLMNEIPLQGDFGISDGRLIRPGNPFQSVLLYRISKLGPGRMPHLGSTLVDKEGVSLLREWIRQLPVSKEIKTPSSSKAELAAKLQHQKFRKQQKSLFNNSSLSLIEAEKLLDSPGNSMLLLELIEKNKISKKTIDKIVSIAVKNPDPYVRDLFEQFIPEEDRVKRLGKKFNEQEFLKIKGRPHAGRELFLKMPGVLCRNCHQIQKQGKMLGPDLSLVGKKYNRVQILENILYPSRKIEKEYATYLVQTDEGKIITGLLLSRDKKKVVLKNTEHKIIEIPTEEIEEIQEQKKSLMPEMLIKDLTPQQAADLLEFLSSLK
jgi:uncharacterized repeat protein (TIGR03806 family)